MADERDAMEQAIIRMRNEHLDEDFIDNYVRQKMASQAGTALQRSARFGTHPVVGEAIPRVAQQQASVPNPILTTEQAAAEAEQRRNMRLGTTMLLGAPMAPALASLGPMTAGGITAGAAGNLLMEGFDKALATVQGHPEEGPSLGGAVVRSALAGGGPAILQQAGQVLAPAARVTKEIVKDTVAQPLGQMLGTLWKKPAATAELGMGRAAVGAAKQEAGTMAAEVAPRNKIVADAAAAGGNLPAQQVGSIVDRLRNAFPGKILPKYKSAQSALNSIADSIDQETLVAGQRQSMPLTRVHELVQQFQEPQFKEAGSKQVASALANIEKPLNRHLHQEIGRTLGPDTLDQFNQYQTTIGQRSQSIKGIKSMFSVPKGQEAAAPVKAADAIKSVLDPQSKQTVLLQDFERNTGIPLYTEMKNLALKRAWNPSDVQRYGWMSIIASRVAGGALGAALAGEDRRGAGFALGMLMGDPRFARPITKFLLTGAKLAPPLLQGLNTALREPGVSNEPEPGTMP